MYADFLPIAFLLTVFFCYVLIKLDKRAAKLGDINLRDSPQTLHTKSVSRFGGVAILGSLTCTALVAGYNFSNSEFFQVGVMSLPAFLAGFIDDLKIQIKPYFRMFLTLPVPIIFFYYFDLKVSNLDIGFLDNFLGIEVFALLFLCFAVVGMINAFNLIDGINGLLVAYLLSIILSLVIVEFAVGPVFEISDEFRIYTNIFLGTLLGFMCLNFPSGKIFMGDAGAYFLGALTCFGLIYAHLANINSSPWAVMCLLAYPFTDLCFSVFRKKVILNLNAMEPDAEHLHHVIFKRMKKIKFKKERARHFFTVCFIVAFNLPYLCLTLYFLNSTNALITIFSVYIISYLLIYFAFSPRFLLVNEK